VLAATLLGLAVLLAAGTLFVAAWFHDVRSQEAGRSAANKAIAEDLTEEELAGQINQFCGACHAMPSPEGFPKSSWHDEVNQGYNFYFDSGRNDLVVPPMARVVEWFQDRAPQYIEVPQSGITEPSARLPFRVEHALYPNSVQKSNSGVSHLAWGVWDKNGAHELLFCDMRWGEIRALDPNLGPKSQRLIAELINPCRALPIDLDADGLQDLVVADLGSYLPQDHDRGRVVWLRATPSGGYQQIVLLEKVGRVADVQPLDFDGDGDLDLVVAEFGWRKTGGILLLENVGADPHAPRFASRALDFRHGTIHVPVADLDGDGRPDFVALISQEYETVEAFLNDGRGGFTRQVLFEAKEPAFGSTGVQLVDFDQDGDLDVIYTNGDAFDSFYLRPFHSVRWLENTGTFPFVDHFIISYPGVHRALAGDLDGDGDLDLAACALIPSQLSGSLPRPDFDAVLWLEQTEPGKFERHGLVKGYGQNACLELADFDADGDLDIAAGLFRPTDNLPCIGVLRNLRIDKGQGRSAKEQ
jgi:hypothetical protein